MPLLVCTIIMMTQELLRTAFSRFGDIHEVVLLRDKGSLLHRGMFHDVRFLVSQLGCAFIVYRKRTSSEAAIAHHIELRPMHESLRNCMYLCVCRAGGVD